MRKAPECKEQHTWTDWVYFAFHPPIRTRKCTECPKTQREEVTDEDA